MNYQPIWKLDYCRITETYEVEGRTYEAQLYPENPGFCAGMAGYGTYCIAVALKEKGQDKIELNLNFRFPKGNNPHQLMEPYEREIATSGSTGINLDQTNRLSAFAEETIGKAVRFYLSDHGPKAPEGMEMNHYSLKIQ
jgi:hypothetical protein